MAKAPVKGADITGPAFTVPSFKVPSFSGRSFTLPAFADPSFTGPSFVFGRLTWIVISFCFLLLSCQPTNTLLSKKGSGAGGGAAGAGSANAEFTQLRIFGADNLPLPGTQTTLALGSTLQFNAALTDLSQRFVSSASVRWNLKTMSGTLAEGLTCGTAEQTTCTLDPVMPGTFYVEALLLERPETLINFSDATHPIVVTAPSIPAQISVVSGADQTAVVNTNLTNGVQLLVTDAFSRPVPGASVLLSVDAGGGSIVGTNPQITDANGLVTAVLKVGTLAGSSNNSFRAEVVGSSPLLQTTLQATAFPGSVHHFVFSTVPQGSYALLPLSTQPVLELRDAFDNRISTLETVTATVASGSGSLSGNTICSSVGGVVTFSDLAYSDSGTGVTLRFQTAGGVEIISDPFNFILPSGVGSITPSDVTFEKAIVTNPGAAGRTSSKVVTVAGISEPIAVTVSGSGNPQVRVNGQGPVTSATNVQVNDTLQLVADAPTLSGSTNVITLVMGGRTETWDLRYVDSQRVAYVFVGSTSGTGATVSPSGTCQTWAAAAGYGGNWSPIISSSGSNLKDIIPWDWGQLRRLDGQLVATSWADLWDGTLLNPISVTQTLASYNGAVWTGAADAVTGTASTSRCDDWTSSSVGTWGAYGDANSASTQWLNSAGQNCSLTARMYCISNPSSLTDDTPTSFSFTDLVKTTASVRETSSTITVTGINKTVTASVAFSGGNAKIKVNGGAEVVSATVYNL